MLEIDETLDRVGKLYHAVTGREPPAAESPYAAIPAEKDPARHVEEQIDELLRALASRGATGAQRRGPFAPRVALFENEHEVALCIDLPGVARDRVTVSIEGQSLVVSGQRRPALSDDHALRFSESPLGELRRAVPLPRGLRLDDARAQMTDGVLEIRIPRDGSGAAAAPRNVPVS